MRVVFAPGRRLLSVIASAVVDQDRIKIQTPFSTTVYQAKISADQLVLQEPGGSKLEFTRIREAQR